MDKNKEKEGYTPPSTLNTLSYGATSFWNQFIYMVFGTYVFFFYEVVVGLASLYVMLAMIIFTLWDAINDPLIGHLTDRITRLTRKWGKRFPWIIIGIIPANFVFVLLFMPPNVNPSTDPWSIVGWIIFSTCLFDTLTTLCFVNASALFPDKFQTDSARRKATGLSTPLGMLSMPIAFIIPPILITFANQTSYINMAWACAIIALIISLLFLPGTRENKELIDRYYISEKVHREGFISALKTSLKQQSFLAYLLLFFGFQVVGQSLTGSIVYSVNFILRSSPTVITLLFSLFLTGGVISVPFWIWLAKRIKNNKKMILIGGVCLIFSTFLVAFHVDVLTASIFNFILGFTMGNYWTLFSLIFADCLDERVVMTKSDQRGAAVGVESFFGRLARGAQVAIFAMVHVLTGFVEGAETYEELAIRSPSIELAIFGIRLHMSIIPCIVLAIFVIVFWKMYKITPEATVKIKAQMKELGF